MNVLYFLTKTVDRTLMRRKTCFLIKTNKQIVESIVTFTSWKSHLKCICPGGLDEIEWQLKLKYCHRFSACAQDARSLGWNLSMLCPEALGNVFCDPLTTIVPDHMPGLISGIGRWVKYSEDRTMTPTKNPMNVGNEWCSPSNCEGSRVSPFPQLVSFSMHCSTWITKRDHFFTRPRGSYRKIPLPHPFTACLPLPAWFRNCHHVVPSKGVFFTQRCRLGGS